MPSRSPWYQLPPEALDVPGHDPETCPVCTPGMVMARRYGYLPALDAGDAYDPTTATATREALEP